MTLDQSAIVDISDYRHRMRLLGRWGACYEVASYIEHRFGWRRRDGVYQMPDGTPVFKHAWNETMDGWIVDGTADQFHLGGDIDAMAPDDQRVVHYRDTYTIAHNPTATPWLELRPWTGEPDDTYWARRHAGATLGPGWWLKDNAAYCRWLHEGAEHYPLFRFKVEEYRARGYTI